MRGTGTGFTGPAAILAASHGDHFARIALSSLLAVAFRRRRPFPVGTACAAIETIAVVKLVPTAALLALVAMATD